VQLTELARYVVGEVAQRYEVAWQIVLREQRYLECRVGLAEARRSAAGRVEQVERVEGVEDPLAGARIVVARGGGRRRRRWCVAVIAGRAVALAAALMKF